ncbi:MAG: phosphoserine phosphatase SerB [Methanocellales archaeon]|nr:phosphoserine phosphatase SerB [Methanocellales archaeon]
MLIVFDMDNTLVDAEIIDELAKAAGVGGEVAAITRKAMQGEIDFGTALRDRVRLLKNLPETDVIKIAESAPIMRGAEQLIKEAKSMGYRTAMISGSFMVVAQKVGEKLGLDRVVANELVIENGVVTGEVTGPLMERNSKELVLAEIVKSEGLEAKDCVVVGDGANDLHMFKDAGLSIAFSPNPVLRDIADVVITQKNLATIIPLLPKPRGDMLEELQEKKEKLKSEAEKLKEKRNKLNQKASKLSMKRDELNQKARELVIAAQTYKKKRDEYNEKVSEHKAKRDELNEKANKVYARLDKLRKKSNASGPSLDELRREIDKLEFRQQTEVLSIDKERQLVERISSLQEKYLKKKEQLEQNIELKTLLEEAQTLWNHASEYHEKVTEYANLAQEQHEKMIATFREVDQIRAEADAVHKEFVKAQETADEMHHEFIKTQKEIRDFDKLIASLKRKSRENREDKKKLEARKKAEEIYDQFRKGEKLDTEDLLLLQRSGLL